MYDRAPRPLTQPRGSTAPGVGPGSYSSSSDERTAQAREGVSYAPFLSMAVRESFPSVSDQLAAAPGPGHYSLQTQHDANSRGAGSLQNKSERFTPPYSRTPGPGAYTISKHSDWIRKTYPPPISKGGQVSWHRQGTAPSIPMPGQDYGYDEDEDGMLRAQALPRRDASMGPAYYNVSREVTVATRRYKGVHFGKLKSQRNPFTGRDGPGPGDYDSDQVVPAVASARSIGSLETTLPRYHELITRIQEKKAVPGPGQYEIKSQFQPTSGLPDNEEGEEEEEEEEAADTPRAPFGSRQQRFLVSKQSSPACTSYQDPRTAFEGRLTTLKKVPFGQTSSRFPLHRHSRQPPGPGAYNNSEVTSLAAELTKKAMLQGVLKHPFGTTSVRTAPLVKRDELNMPGPAHYQQRQEEGGEDPVARPPPPPPPTGLAAGGGLGKPVVGKGAVGKPSLRSTGGEKLSSTFASTSKRLYSPPSIVTDIPPPGSYEVSESHSKSQGRAEQQAGSVRGAFLSSSDRFAPPRDILLEEPDAYNPGPGEYKHTSVLCKGKPGLLCFRDNRFKPIKSAVPGPGSYQLSRTQKDTLLQGTFNSTLANPLCSSSSNSQEKNRMDVVTSAKKQAFVLGV